MSMGIEIERKFVIKMPSADELCAMPDHTVSEISQTYLETVGEGVTERVRSRRYIDTTRFYHTVKQRIDKLSCKEDEREIDEDEYIAFLERRDRSGQTVEKTRHTFSLGALTVEIDKYKGWDNLAVLEVEIPTRDTELRLPDFIEVVFEATGRFELSNAGLYKHFPTEDELLSSYL